MKNLLILKASTLLLVLPVYSNSTLNRAIIEFSHGGSRLTQSVIHQVDQVYEKLPINFQVELVVVSNYEQQRDYPMACRLSLNRCKAIYEYLRGRGVEEHRFNVKQYERRREVRMLDYEQALVTDRLLINHLVVSRQPEMPMIFSHSGFDPLENQGNSFTIDNSEASEIYDSKGVIVRIPENAFLDENGLLVECDLIDVELHTFLSKAEFLAADITSNAGERMLESGGMLHIMATCNGEKLQLKRGKLIEIFIPNYDVKRNMQVFEGKDEFGIVNWERMSWSNVEPRQEELIEEETWEDEESYLDGGWVEGDGYLLQSSSLGWINCDLFYGIDNPTKLLVDTDVDSGRVSVRLVFDTINSILPARILDTEGLMSFDEIPAGEAVTVLGYGKVNGKFVFAQHRMTTGSSHRIALELEEVDKPTLMAMLSKF